MKNNYVSYFNWLMAPLGKSSIDLVEGCPECDGPESWPESRAIVYAYLVVAIYGLANYIGEVPAITSGYRCGPCNIRRGGATKSRHLAGEHGGLEYGAVDIQWKSGVIGNRFDNLKSLPQTIREITGLNVGVGVIAYKGNRRIHVDFRERDFVDDQR